MTGIIAFFTVLCGLGVVFFAHEFGHFLMARLFGMQVPYFTLGAGPVLWRKNIGKTQFRVSAFPFLASVVIAGALLPDEMNEEIHAGWAKDETLTPEMVEHFDDKTTWMKYKAGWQQLLVSLAGPFFNFILAMIVTFGVLTFRGQAVLDIPLTVHQVTPDSPVAELISVGDTVSTIDGRTITSNADFQAAFQLVQPGSTMKWAVQHDGVEQIVAVNIPKAGKTPDLGVLFSTTLEHPSPVRALLTSALEIMNSVKMQIVGLGLIIFGGASVDNLMGPIGVISVGTQITSQGFMSFLYFVKAVSVGLGVVNLMPIPPLDGARSILALLRIGLRKPLPDRVTHMFELSGVCLLLGLMVFFVINDIMRFFPA